MNQHPLFLRALKSFRRLRVPTGPNPPTCIAELVALVKPFARKHATADIHVMLPNLAQKFVDYYDGTALVDGYELTHTQRRILAETRSSFSVKGRFAVSYAKGQASLRKLQRDGLVEHFRKGKDDRLRLFWLLTKSGETVADSCKLRCVAGLDPAGWLEQPSVIYARKQRALRKKEDADNAALTRRQILAGTPAEHLLKGSP